MKVLAYTSQFGHHTVTPLEAKSRNLGIVYSCHRPGQRLEMYVTHKREVHYFAYKGERGDREGQTNSESLTHVLCKKVLAELADSPEGCNTVLGLTENTLPGSPIEVHLHKAEQEYRIDIDGNTYFIDVLLYFRQPGSHPLLSHEAKWQGRLAIEIWHTSRLAASDPKCRSLAKAGIPVIQISAKPGSHLALDESHLANQDPATQQQLLEAHMEKLRRTFRKQILGVLLKNPSSEAFQTASALYEEIAALKDNLNSLHENHEALAQELAAAREICASLSREKAILMDERNQLALKLEKLAKRAQDVHCEPLPLPCSDKNGGLRGWLAKLFK